MAFRRTIAAKIFGLAIILLLLTIALAGFLLYEVTRTKQDLTVVANFDVPLTQSLARLHEFGLRRRLAFERWFGALNAAEPNREIVAEELRSKEQMKQTFGKYIDGSSVIQPRVNHIAARIINAEHSIMRLAGVLGVSDCVRNGIRLAVPRPTEW